MQHVYVLVLLFLSKVEANRPNIQYCARNLFRSPVVFPQCKPNEYCLSSDQDRHHLDQFSTKNAYQTKKILDEKDYTVDGVYFNDSFEI